MKRPTRTAIVLAIGSLALAAAACSSDDPTPTPTVEPAKVEVPAPIESVQVLIAESFPPQYFLEVVSGLPNGCVEFDRYDMSRSGTRVQVKVTNLAPAPGADVACTDNYRTVQHNIVLGTDFEPGTTYTAVVNGVTETFVAQ